MVAIQPRLSRLSRLFKESVSAAQCRTSWSDDYGRYESNVFFFFFHNYNYGYNEMYTCHAYIVYKAQVIFQQSLRHYQHTFSTFAWDAVCRWPKTLCWSIGALCPCWVLAPLCPQNGLLEMHPSRGQKDESRLGGGCYIETLGRMRENSLPHCCNCLCCALTGVVLQEEDVIRLPVWPNFSNSLFNVCAYRFELIVAAHDRISSLSHKTLAMTLPAEVCILNIFFQSGDERLWYSIDRLFFSKESALLIALEKF